MGSDVNGTWRERPLCGGSSRGGSSGIGGGRKRKRKGGRVWGIWSAKELGVNAFPGPLRVVLDSVLGKLIVQ